MCFAGQTNLPDRARVRQVHLDLAEATEKEKGQNPLTDHAVSVLEAPAHDAAQIQENGTEESRACMHASTANVCPYCHCPG